MAPRFSIVVPTYRRAAALARCLDACAALRGPAFEVVVVDDGSPEPVDEIVDARRDRLDVKRLRQPNRGPAAARNAGARAARGTYVVLCDDDGVPDPGWLEAFARAGDAHPGAALGGRTLNGRADDPYATATHAMLDYLCGRMNARTPRFFPSMNLCVPAEGYRALGGFDESFSQAAGEDRDFCDRWLRSGRALQHVADAVVRHEHALDLRAFWSQHASYGRGARHVRRLVAAREERAPRLERAGFYLGLLRHPFRVLPARRAVPIAALLGVAQLATTWGYLRAGGARAPVPRAARTP